MIKYILYLITLIRLRWSQYNKRWLSRFDKYSPYNDLSKFDAVGLVANATDWDLSTPKLDRNENVSIFASNNADQSSLNLKLKWRPNSKLEATTLLSQLALNIDGHSLVYDAVTTYRPSKTTVHPDRIVQYGSRGSCLKLVVISPYRRYRLVFRGEMQELKSASSIDSKPTTHFVKLNLLIFQTSKVYDFKNQFSLKDVAAQVTSKKPKCGLFGALDELILHDKHEQTVKLVGEYSLMSETGSPKTENKLNLWGFHSRQIVDTTTQKMRSKQIVGMFKNGRAFHLGVRESVDNNFDPDQRFEYGYACFRLSPSVEPIEALNKKCGSLVDWKHVTGNATSLNFSVAGQGLTFKVEAKRRSDILPSCSLMNMTLDSKVDGWGAILINDSLDTSDELLKIQSSLREYEHNLASGVICDGLVNNNAADELQQPLVVSIEDRKCLSSGLVGAKASSLAHLRAYSNNENVAGREHYQVPDAVVLTKFAYDEILGANPNLEDEIRRFSAQIGQGNVQTLESECQRMVQLFEVETKLPSRVCDQLKKLMESVLDLTSGHSDDSSEPAPAFIVRSSSWGEDEEDMSAAGQLTSILSVRGTDRLHDAVMKCFASKFSYQNIEYKRQHGLPLDAPMAVIVQKQIDCDKAGVMFTCDPVSGDPRSLLITANYGLGESVVSAKTDPDTIRISVGRPTHDLSPTLKIGEVQVGAKNDIITENQVNLDEIDRTKCCLDDEDALRLSRCGLNLAQFFQAPCDIEWGQKDERVYLFQSRPITGLDAYTDYELFHEADEPSRAEVEFLSRCNVNEVLPYAMTPLFSNFMVKTFKMASFFMSHKLGKVRLVDYSLDYFADFAILTHHAFFGLRSSGLFEFGRASGQEKSLMARAVEIGLFGHEVDNHELTKAATDMASPVAAAECGHRLELMKANLMNLKLRLIPDKFIASLKKRHARLRRDIQSLRFSKSGASLAGLWQQVQVLTRYTRATNITHYSASIISSTANLNLLTILSKYTQEPAQLFAALSKILAASPNVLSGEIPHRIERMAKLIVARGKEEAESFVGMSPTEALKYISCDLKSELAKEFDIFMVKFGHRSYNEFELSHPPWRDTPEVIMELIKANVRGFVGADNADTLKKDVKPKSLDDIINSCNINLSLCDKLKLKWCLAPRSQKFVAVREKTKDLTVEYQDLMRDAMRLLARALRQSNRLPDEELFYYLNLYEIEPLVREAQPSIVVQATRRRKFFKKTFKEAWRYDEVIRVSGEVLPSHLEHQSPDAEIPASAASKLHGTPASSGKVRGKVCLVSGYDELTKVQANSILVAYSTDIAFSPIFPLVSGVITEVGGLVSHGAVVAREYGLPSVIGVKNVTKLLRDGEEILLDADNGIIVRLEHDKSDTFKH